MEDETKRIWQAIEHLRDDVYGDGASNGVAANLQRLADGLAAVRVDVLGVKEEVRGVKDHMRSQNGTINQMKLDAATAAGAAGEREKWEQRQAANIKWLFMAGLAAAGVLSGVVFGVIDRLTQ